MKNKIGVRSDSRSFAVTVIIVTVHLLFYGDIKIDNLRSYGQVFTQSVIVV